MSLRWRPLFGQSPCLPLHGLVLEWEPHGQRPSQGQTLHLLLPCRERFGDYELAIMEHSRLSKCFPIIKSLPAVKAQVKMCTSHWAGPGASIEEGGQQKTADQNARVAVRAQHGRMSSAQPRPSTPTPLVASPTPYPQLSHSQTFVSLHKRG